MAKSTDQANTRHLEVERKFEVVESTVSPSFDGLSAVLRVERSPAQQLDAVYFDTPGRDLAAHHITLRRRTGGTDAGWHLKLPAGTETRREVHVPLGPGGEPVPDDLSGLVADWVHGQPLRPIARLQTTRTVRRLTDATGQVLAEVADDEVTGSLPDQDAYATDAPPDPAAWRTATAWREVEIELVH